MFDLGFWEITLIFILMLLIVGPERLPRLARTAGLWIGKARTMVASVKAEVEQELKVNEIKNSITRQSDVEEIKRLADQVKSINSDVRSFESKLRSTATKVASSASTAEIPSAESRSADKVVIDKTSSASPPPSSEEK